MRPVTVQFLKNPDILHWGFEAFWLGEDEWGAWIAVPTGTKRWKGAEEMSPTKTPAVFCAPREQWWHLHFNGTGRENYTHFVDIVTPAVWAGDCRYEMIDLDLDVAVHVDGSIEVQDEDEFEVHQVRYGYTPDMVRRALEETEWVVSALERRNEPFFDVAAAWLARV